MDKERIKVMKEFLETCGSNLPSSEGQMIIDPRPLLKSEIKRSEALFIMVKFIADWIIEQEDSGPKASDLLAWMKARPGASWVATIKDVEKAIAAILRRDLDGDELLADAMKLLDVAGMWKAPIDDQWRESYADLRKRYKSAKINPETGDEL